MDGVRISAKTLGALAMPQACDRCAWVKLRLKLPYQIFPGIFSSIDAYTKHVVHGHFDRQGCAPSWLAPLGAISGYLNPPHHTKFLHQDPTTGILLTGTPDALLATADNGLIILDYKTARHTRGQDELLPMYEIQLNVYARIAQALGYPPVRALALAYMEPRTDPEDARDANAPEGFAMHFRASIQPVRVDPNTLLPPLLERAAALVRAATPPPSRAGCKDCAATDALADALRTRRVDVLAPDATPDARR